ncbi:MAG: D-2-hydroxyacid dehydrogenase [Sphaerochaetaceae bacterium]|nr:D-2-hydroxyacid dehydrogenase [Sphaerochaetaceae bacterium]
MRALLLEGLNFYPTDEELRRLRESFPSVDFTVRKRGDYDSTDIDSFDIIMGFPRVVDLKRATRLKWLQTPSAGVDQFTDITIFAHPYVILTKASGTYGRQIGDHVIGFIIAHNHSFLTHYENMKQRKWELIFPHKDLRHSTVAIIGFGDLGRQIARKSKALDMEVLVVRNKEVNGTQQNVERFFTADRMHEAVEQADYVVLAAAGTQDTYHLIDAAMITHMKQGSVLINVARGSLVDEKALIEALERRYLDAAYLDVTEQEPLDPESPLWSMENVLITAHCSGLSRNSSSLVNELFTRNLTSFLTGQEMHNVVDFSRGY